MPRTKESGIRRFFRLVRVMILGPERVVAWRIAKNDYWFGAYYDFNTQHPTTTYTRTFRNQPISAAEVPNPFYWPGMDAGVPYEPDLAEREDRPE